VYKKTEITRNKKLGEKEPTAKNLIFEHHFDELNNQSKCSFRIICAVARCNNFYEQQKRRE